MRLNRIAFIGWFFLFIFLGHYWSSTRCTRLEIAVCYDIDDDSPTDLGEENDCIEYSQMVSTSSPFLSYFYEDENSQAMGRLLTTVQEVCFSIDYPPDIDA